MSDYKGMWHRTYKDRGISYVTTHGSVSVERSENGNLKELDGGGASLFKTDWLDELNKLGMPNPISRNTDPQTSKDAEIKHTLGPRAKRARQVLELVRDYPLYTSGELSRNMHIKHPKLPFRTCAETPHKRLPELFDKGLVQHRGERECTDSGYMALQWEITEAGERELL